MCGVYGLSNNSSALSAPQIGRAKITLSTLLQLSTRTAPARGPPRTYRQCAGLRRLLRCLAVAVPNATVRSSVNLRMMLRRL